MIAEQRRTGLSLIGGETFSSPNVDSLTFGTTESSWDDKMARDSIILANNELQNFIDERDITCRSIFLEGPQDLTQAYEFHNKAYFLADIKKIEAFVIYVRQKLREKDLMISELQFEIDKLNKKRKFSSAGFRLPKDYYENDAYIVE